MPPRAGMEARFRPEYLPSPYLDVRAMTDLILTQQALENRRVLLSVELPKERLDELMRTAARRLSREYRFPGFRPGKVPYHVVLQRIGRENLLREVAASIGEEILQEALAATGIEPHGPIDLDITLEPFVFRFEIPLAPKVELGDYRSIRIEPPILDEAAVEEHVREHLEAMLRDRRIWQDVDRPAAYGDRLVVDFRLEVDGEEVLSNEDWDFIPDETDYTLTPEFDAAFIGMRAGEHKTFSVVLPEDSQWPGKEGHFTVTLKAVKARQTPELTDELAQELGAESAEALLNELRAHALEIVQASQKDEYTARVLKAITEQSQVEFSPFSLQAMIDFMLEQEANQFKSYGIESPEEYLRLTRMTREAYAESRRAVAETRLKEHLVLRAIIEREQFPVSDYELDRELVDRYGHSQSLLDEARELLAEDEEFRERVVRSVRISKALNLLIRIARGEPVPAPGDHQAEEGPPAAAPVAEAEGEAVSVAEAEDEPLAVAAEA